MTGAAAAVRPPVEEPASARAITALAGGIAAYVALFAVVSLLKFRSYLYDDFDLAIFTQALAQLGRGSTFVSIRGMSWLGDHSSLTLFLLAPLYALAPRAETLLVVQSVVLALGAIPVFRIARRALGSEPAALLFAAAYLAYPALGYTNLFEFHPETLCTTTLLATLDALLGGRTRWALVWGGLSLLAKEDVALVVLGIGLWSLARSRFRERAPGIALCALALASLVLSFAFLKPHGNAGEAEYGRMYAAFGSTPGEVALHALTHPIDFARSLVGTPGNPLDGALKREFLLHLVLPLALLPLAAPGTLLIALPILAAHLASSRVQQHTIVFQYTALLTPVLVVAAIEGYARIGRWRGEARRPLLLALALATLAGQVLFGPFGMHAQRSRPPQAVVPSASNRAMARHYDRMISAVPAHGTVVSGFETLARFANRPDVHSLHHLLSGRFTYSSRSYPLPSGAAAILGDFASPRLLLHVDEGSAKRLRTVIASSGLEPAGSAGDLMLFDHEPNTPSVQLIGPAAPEARGLGRHTEGDAGNTPEQGTQVTFDGQLRWLGARAPRQAAADPSLIELLTFWERVAPVDRMFLMELAVVDAGGRIVHHHLRWLGYVIAPPGDWPLREPMGERYRLVLPESLPPGSYAIRMRLHSRIGLTIGACRTEPPLESIDLGRVAVR